MGPSTLANTPDHFEDLKVLGLGPGPLVSCNSFLYLLLIPMDVGFLISTFFIVGFFTAGAF